jgi:F0F1-type ATP synthase assembly protein I
MLVEIFSAPIASGAQLFWLIVCILIGLGAGISAIDFRSTVFKKSEKEE